MKNSIVVLALLLIGIEVAGQSWQSDVASGQNFYEILEKYEGTAQESKQFERWARFMAPRVYPEGNVSNLAKHTYDAYNRMIRAVDNNMSRSTNGNWECVGPFDYTQNGGGGAMGRVNRITFHPTLTNTFWVGTAVGGVWKTTNGGDNWTPQTDGLPSIGISGICINPDNTSEQYILTGDGDGGDSRSIGVLKSTDNGFSWLPTGLSWDVSALVTGFNMIMHPDNPAILIAATSAGLFKTSDGGNSWTSVGDTSNVFWDVEFAPGSPDTVYAATENGLLVSSNTGDSFSYSPDGSLPDDPDFTRLEIAVSPSTPATVYLLFGGGSTGFTGLYKSSDYGQTFALKSTSPNIMTDSPDGTGTFHQAGYDIALTVDPSDDNTIYVGGINVWKSTNGGVTWSVKTDRLRIMPGIAWIHADIHELEFNGSRLYAVNDGGVYYSDDGGDNWTEKSAGLAISQFYYIDIHDNDYVGGTQDNGTYGANVNNTQAQGILDGDGFAAIYHDGNTSIQYISNQNNKVRRQFGSNATITPGGIVPSGSNFLFWDEDMDVHTTDPDYLFIANWELYKGNGDAINFTWDTMNVSFNCTAGNGCRITTISQGLNDDDVMYLSNEDQIIRSANINSTSPTWTNIPKPANLACTDILVNPANADHIWASFSGYNAGQKVYQSIDAGATWLPYSDGLPNVPANCLIQDPSTMGVYVGTDIGVFYRDSAHTEWIYFSNGLPNTTVADMDIENGFLYVGTYGRGIWRTSTYTSCPFSQILTTATNPSVSLSMGTQIYHASNNIQTTMILNGGIGTYIEYNAPQYIDMKPGFWAKQGNEMTAQIDGCPD